MSVKYFCDICGQQIAKPRLKPESAAGALGFSFNDERDFCADCERKMRQASSALWTANQKYEQKP